VNTGAVFLINGADACPNVSHITENWSWIDISQHGLHSHCMG